MSAPTPNFQGPTSPQQQGFAAPGGNGQQSFAQQAMPPQHFGPGGGFAQAQPPLKVVGPLMMLVGAALAVVGTLLPWYRSRAVIDNAGGGFSLTDGETWNGFDQMQVNIEAGRSYGTLMLIAFIVAAIGCVAVIIAAIGALARAKGNAMGGIALIGAILGLIATLGTLIGYMALGATHSMGLGTWVYGLSFIIVLIGAIGVRSKKF